MIDIGFKYTVFPSGQTESIVLNSDLQIDLSFDHRVIVKNKSCILIRFRNPRNASKSCLKMFINSWERQTIVIEKVHIENCDMLGIPQQKLKHCFMYLALLFCTYMRPEIIRLYDCNCQDNQNDYRNYKIVLTHTKNKNERKNLRNTLVLPDHTRSHTIYEDYSYFAPYGFHDEVSNDSEIIDCIDNTDDSESDDECVPLEKFVAPEKFTIKTSDSDRSEGVFTMIFHLDTISDEQFDSKFKMLLLQIQLTDLNSLCVNLPCDADIFKGQCVGGQFKYIIEAMNENQQEQKITETETTATTTNNSTNETESTNNNSTLTESQTIQTTNSTDDKSTQSKTLAFGFTKKRFRFPLFPYRPVSFRYL